MKISDLPKTDRLYGELVVRPNRQPVTVREWLASNPDLLQGIIGTLTDEQRLDLFRPWCSECGGPAPCQCWNDE